MGGTQVTIVTREHTRRLMNVIAAPLVKPFMSVKQFCGTGHAVVFDDEGSYIVNKQTGEFNMLREEGGNYMLDCWVPPNAAGFQRQP